MKLAFLLLFVFFISITAKGQNYTKAQIININNLKQAYDGDIYIDVLNKDYYIGSYDSTLSQINSKIDSAIFINDSSLVFYWNFKESDTIDFSSILDTNEWVYNDETGVKLRRAVMTNVATDDSVFFSVYGRLIIADSIKNTLTYQNSNASTQIFLANFNPTRNVARQISIQNENTAGNRAYSLFTTATDSSRMFMGSHGSSRTLNRMGLPVKNSSEIVAIEGDLHIGTRELNSIYFGTNDLSRGVWDQDGNVGIGTVEPFVPWINASGGLSKLASKFAVKTITGRQDISFFSTANTSNPVSIFLSAPLSTGDTGSMILSYRGNHVTPLYTDWVDFVTNDGNGTVRERMLRFNMLNGDVVFDEAKVGIHTNTPTDTLDIDGTLRVREMQQGTSSDSIVTADANGQLHKRSLDSIKKDFRIATVITKTASYTLTPNDLGAVFRFNSSTPMTLTIPSGFPIGSNISVYQVGTGQVTIVGSGGVTVRNRLSIFKTAGQDAGVGIMATDTDVYHITGDLTK